MKYSSRQGWTLVETLVVVAILLVVISLYSAALDKSFYEATLLRCHTDQHAIGVGLISYATQFKNRYPHRAGVENDDDWAPIVIADNEPDAVGGAGVLTKYDDRPALKSFIQINKQMNCSMVRPVDLETTDDRTRVSASQALWYGWRYKVDVDPVTVNGKVVKADSQWLKGMNRIGDRLEWDGRSFAVLAGDWTAFSREDDVAIGSHPDFYDGIMGPEWAENIQTFWWLADPVTYSFWTTPETSWPGPVDRMFLYDDGSVRRLTRVQWRATTDPDGAVLRDRQEWARIDERTIRVPERVKDDPSRSTHLPRE